MVLSGGIILFICALGTLVIPKRFLSQYCLLTTAFIFVMHWFLPQQGQFSFEFFGFDLELYVYHPLRQLVASAFSFYALIFFIYVFGEQQSRWFYFLSMMHVAAALSFLFVNDSLSFFIFWELIAVSVVLLVLEQGYHSLISTYFYYQMTSAVLLFIGIGITYSVSNSLQLAVVPAAYPFVILAVCIKMAILPFHVWMLETYPKVPPTLAVLLSGYGTKVGVFSLWLLLPNLKFEVIGGIVAVVAILYAFKQHSIRRFLSFHIISQIGYMIAGIGSLSTTSVTGAMLHIVNHIIYKGLLFMIAGILLTKFGTDNMLEIRGAGRRSPLLFVSAIVAAASIAGMPPFNGYFSKTLLTQDLSSITYYLLTIATVGTAISFSKFIHYTFLAQEKQLQTDVSLPVTWQITLISLSFTCLILGIGPALFWQPTVLEFKPLLTSGFAVFAGITLFKWKFEAIHHIAVLITPETASVSKKIAFIYGKAVIRLRGFHTGNIQDYLLWFFASFVLIWICMFLWI